MRDISDVCDANLITAAFPSINSKDNDNKNGSSSLEDSNNESYSLVIWEKSQKRYPMRVLWSAA